jgi:hypothetical protein
MLIDLWAELGAFLSENCGTVLTVGIVLLIIAQITQFIINSSLEEDIEELEERVEELEKMHGIMTYADDDSNASCDENVEENRD